MEEKSRQTNAEIAIRSERGDMAINQMTTEMAEDRQQLHVMIGADPLLLGA